MATLNVNGLVNGKRKRLVRVMIVDNDPNVPAASSIISQREIFTDTTNDGLRLSLNFLDELNKHNERRKKFYRETQEGNKVYLKALDIAEVQIRITDLEVF